VLCVGIKLPEESGDSGFSTGLLYLTTCTGAREVSVKLISPYSREGLFFSSLLLQRLFWGECGVYQACSLNQEQRAL